MKKGGVALIGMILALVFIIIAFIGPWYSMSFMGMSIDVGLTTEATSGVDRGPFDTTMYIAIFALITSILAFIGILGLSFGFGSAKTMKSIGGIFGILTFILALIAPLYFMTSAFLEGLGEIGFWNDFGGPGYGWYIMIIAAIIALIASTFIFKEKTTA